MNYAFTMDPLSFSRIHNNVRQYTMNSRFVPKIHCGIIFFTNPLWIYYSFIKLTMNSLPISEDILVFMVNGPYKSKSEKNKIAWFASSCWLSFSFDAWLASGDHQNPRFKILTNQVLEEKFSIVFTNSL